jgi:mRNA interferase YafQ
MNKAMLIPDFTNQFRKDIERMKRRGKNIGKLKAIIDTLLAQEPLPAKNKDHKLQGDFADQRECHVEPDWLLIYTRETLTLRLDRTGSHEDLFG